MVLQNRASIILFLTLFILSGCSGLNPKPLDTASGRPEIVISNTVKANIRQEIGNKMLDKGYTLTEETEQKLTFEKENFQGFGQKLAVGVLVGGEDNRDRVIFNFLTKNQTELRIMVEDLYIHTTDKGDNRLTARRQFYPEWQTFLNNLDKGTSSNAKTTQDNASTQPAQTPNKTKSTKKRSH